MANPKYLLNRTGTEIDNILSSAESHVADDSKHITSEERTKWDAKSDFSGNYNDLTNKPTIPSISGLATETYVNNKVAGIVESAPETLDTLNELAAALGDDPNFATTVATQIGGKVDKVDGKGLSTNDYTTAEKNKLAGIAEGANNYTHPNTHAATMITEDSTHRFVTDAEKTTWNNKANTDLTNIDNSTFKAKVEASGFTSGTQVQICKWEEID